MKRTPVYKLPFFQGGDLYSASLDEERMIVTDNQLDSVSKIIGNGVLSGWTISHVEKDLDSATIEIEVSPGSGFINNIFHKTVSLKRKIVISGVQTFVYMQSRMVPTTGGLKLEAESPASNSSSATFTDVIAPATPTGFIATAEDFDLINLFWDSNDEDDFDHYQIWRSTALLGPFSLIAEPETNGVSPDDPYQDVDLLESTTYFYRVYAVDKSGNVSGFASASDTTLPNTNKPSEPGGLQVFASNTTISLIWNASLTPDVTYRITQQTLNLDGSILTGSTVVFDDLTTLYWQLVGLTNSTTYRITLQSKSPGGILSNGYITDVIPVSAVSPLDPLLDTALPAAAVVSMTHSIKLNWLASPSPTGSSISQKTEYAIRVIENGNPSVPIKFIGTGLSKLITAFRELTNVGGLGLTKTLEDDVVYVFRISTLDALGNESVGLYLKGTTLDVTLPKDPRNLRLVAGDEEIQINWKHSASTDVVDYILNVNAGPDISIGYYESYLLTGLTNGTSYSIKLRAKDDVGNISSPGTTGISIPTVDIVAPIVPLEFNGISQDQQAVISWSPNPEPDLDHYVLKRVAVAENLLVSPNAILTEITELQEIIASGTVSDSSTIFVTSEDFIGLSDMTGNVLVVTSGDAEDQKATISAFNSFTGEVTLATSLDLAPAIGDDVVIRATHPSLGTLIRDVGTATSILDIELLNGQVYAYTVQAVDFRGNESEFSNRILVAPTSTLNDLSPPTDLVATYGGGEITLTWDQIVPDDEHPATDHNAFNIYRSTSPESGFVLIDSVDPDVLTYVDSNLINGQTYYYVVTAIRDNADVVIDTGALVPPNSILLGTVKLIVSSPLGSDISEITNEQRLVEHLQAAIEDEAEFRLLNHRHLVRPLNSVTIDASALLSMVDASLLSEIELDDLDLSSTTVQYYNNLIKDKTTGQTIVYDAGTTYVISPSSIINDLPHVGDFQVLVNGEIPTAEFSIDQDRNAVIFPTALTEEDVVSLDGTGFNYYVPAKLDLGNRGFSVQVDGKDANVNVDEALQTIRFSVPLGEENVVKVTIEPLVPDFGSQQGSRQISLNPNIVLSDFTTKNRILYESESGTFGDTDTFFVLVNGERTQKEHVVDTTEKTITFDSALETADVVALEILNREEVQGNLSARRIKDLDGSQFKTGVFIKPQLPSISHQGRVRELALPLFQELTTNNKYLYQAEEGIIGTGVTPYSFYQFDDGKILLGTSSGLLKASGFAAFTGEGESVEATIDYSLNPPAGLVFKSATPDSIVQDAEEAAKFSGRFNGQIQIVTLTGSGPTPQFILYGPNLLIMEDGKVLISGGAFFRPSTATYHEVKSTYIYDPSTQLMTQVGDLNGARRGHSGVRLPDGNILVCGGSTYHIVHLDPVTFTPDIEDTVRLKTTEIYDVVTKTWTPAADMSITRDYHTCNMINESEVLISGGNTGVSSYNGIFKPPRYSRPEDTETAQIFDIFLGTWRDTAPLNKTRVNAESKLDGGVVIVTKGGQEGREIFSKTPIEKWTFEGKDTEKIQDSLNDEFGPNSIDGPVKQFLRDSLGLVLLVSRNNVYATQDGERFVKTKGLEAVGVVHQIAQGSNNTLYAATDLGVYEIIPELHDQLTWFQGGLIGAGTTETFDILQYGDNVLAATEIGVFYTTNAQNGDVWTQLNTDGTEFEDVFNLEKIGDLLFLNAGQTIYRSDDGGDSWSELGSFDFIDSNAKMVARDPLDLIFATGTGLYASRDGVEFFLVDFDLNRHPNENNVHMAIVVGSDIYVGYDNVLFAVGPEFETLKLTEFVGIIPTVTVNGIEIRNGFRYDIRNGQITFEFKRLANDIIKVTSNYGLYELVNGPWYRHNPNAAYIIYVNGKIQSDDTFTANARRGQISFNEDLMKTDIVTVSIAGTSLDDEGEMFHEELEDRIEQEKGLPLSLGRDYVANILQMGLGIDHNFWERGIERNQYYCSQESLVDRSFTSFLVNAEFYILGKREFDRFNSTIDFKLESSQNDIGSRALVPLSSLQVGSLVWVGTENGIFVLDASSPDLEISDTIQVGPLKNAIRDLGVFLGDFWVISSDGIYISEDGITFEKNIGNGLPSSLFSIVSLNNVVILATSDAIYYSDGINDVPSYSIWFRGNFVEGETNEEVIVNLPCQAMATGDSLVYAGIGRGIYRSTDGKVWRHVFDFDDDEITIVKMIYFSRKLYIGTNKGLFTDDGTARSTSVGVKLERIDPEGSEIPINDLFVYSDGTTVSLYAVGNKGKVYRLSNEIWTSSLVPGVTAIHEFIITSSGKQIALSNDQIFVQ